MAIIIWVVGSRDVVCAGGRGGKNALAMGLMAYLFLSLFPVTSARTVSTLARLILSPPPFSSDGLVLSSAFRFVSFSPSLLELDLACVLVVRRVAPESSVSGALPGVHVLKPALPLLSNIDLDSTLLSGRIVLNILDCRKPTSP